MTISAIFFLMAAILSLMGALAHEFLGAPKVLGPLKDSSLPDEVMWLHHFSWHVGTVAVIGLAAMFLLAIWHPAGTILALIAAIMSAGFGLLGISLAIFCNAALWRTPAPYPWGIIAVLGMIGVIIEKSTL